jgi:hypothetical protein
MSNLTTIPNSQNCGCIHPPGRTDHPCFPDKSSKQPPQNPNIYRGLRGYKMSVQDGLTLGRTLWNIHRNRDQFIEGRRRRDMPHYPGPSSQYNTSSTSK